MPQRTQHIFRGGLKSVFSFWRDVLEELGFCRKLSQGRAEKETQRPPNKDNGQEGAFVKEAKLLLVKVIPRCVSHPSFRPPPMITQTWYKPYMTNPNEAVPSGTTFLTSFRQAYLILLHFTVLCFTDVVILQTECKTFQQQKYYDPLYCNTHIIVMVWK